MKDVKLYNVIFPIWLLLFFPPIIFLTLAGNFIIDSLVIVACYYGFKLISTHSNLKTFYNRSILKVWLFGFLADIAGAIILFVLGMIGDSFGLSNEFLRAINYDPFSNSLALLVIILSMLVSGFLIFLFNYKITFGKDIEDKKLRFKIALTVAIITIPWTFLLPTKWFYI